MLFLFYCAQQLHCVFFSSAYLCDLRYCYKIIKLLYTCFCFSKLCSLHWPNGWVQEEYCNFSRSSIRAKFFLSPHTPESPTWVGCLSNGQRMAWLCCGSLVRQWWHTVWPQWSRRGTRSPCRLNTSSQTRHSTYY